MVSSQRTAFMTPPPAHAGTRNSAFRPAGSHRRTSDSTSRPYPPPSGRPSSGPRAASSSSASSTLSAASGSFLHNPRNQSLTGSRSRTYHRCPHMTTPYFHGNPQHARTPSRRPRETKTNGERHRPATGASRLRRGRPCRTRRRHAPKSLAGPTQDPPLFALHFMLAPAVPPCTELDVMPSCGGTSLLPWPCMFWQQRLFRLSSLARWRRRQARADGWVSQGQVGRSAMDA